MNIRAHHIIPFFVFLISFFFMYKTIMSVETGNMEKVFAIQNEYGSVLEKTQLDDVLSNKPIEENQQDENRIQKYIYIDLDKMLVTTVTESSTSTKMLASYAIVSKGKPGSYYETPVGIYKIKSKEYSHFSRLGEVYMPYSMQFYGNFFIHGIPYHSDGTRVSSAYSGGCIRMNDINIKDLFAFANYDTKVIILNYTDMTDSGAITDIGKGKSKSIIDALISLEFLDQERIVSLHGERVKIKSTIKNIVDGDLDALQIIKNTLGDVNYNNAFLEKAYAIGIDANLENETDRVKLLNYIRNNKSYLLQYI